MQSQAFAGSPFLLETRNCLRYLGKMRANCEVMRPRRIGRVYTTFARQAIPPSLQLGLNHRREPSDSWMAASLWLRKFMR